MRRRRQEEKPAWQPRLDFAERSGYSVHYSFEAIRGMQKRRDDLTPTKQDIQRLRVFVRRSKGVPQLVRARMHAICLLAEFGDNHTPPFEPAELEEFLKLSPQFKGNKTGKPQKSSGKKRQASARALSAA